MQVLFGTDVAKHFSRHREPIRMALAVARRLSGGVGFARAGKVVWRDSGRPALFG